MKSENLQQLSNEALVSGIRVLVANERKITREILDYINELERRRLCVELGFASSFDWLTKALGYSAPAAYRRIQAAQLLLSIDGSGPDGSGAGGSELNHSVRIGEKIETGAVNLTTLAQVQTTIKAEEKRSGTKMSIPQKKAIVAKVESKSSREAERVLAEMFPQTVVRKESVTVVDENHVRAHVTLTQTQLKKLERIGELLSHRLSKGGCKPSLGDIIEAAADELLKRRDPLLKAPQSMPQSKTGAGPQVKQGNSIGAARKRQIIVRDQGKCQYRDPRTGQQCENRFHLQIDHVYPKALGGSNETENLRALCRAHNLLMAERWLGAKQMDPYRTRE